MEEEVKRKLPTKNEIKRTKNERERDESVSDNEFFRKKCGVMVKGNSVNKKEC